MSEYQYYEFQAVDRRLNAREMTALRSCSSRATITPTSFVNDYSWGNFKGDPRAWMRKYFDGFLYVANWGTHELMLRLPAASLPARVAKTYCRSPMATAQASGRHVVLTFSSEDETEDLTETPQGILASLLPLRTELATGDLRALYLGWLSGVQALLTSDDEREPPCPPGLRTLTPALDALVDFLRLDTRLVDAAARASADLTPVGGGRELRRWVAALPDKEKTALLARVAAGEDAWVRAELARRFRSAREDDSTPGSAKPRTVRALREESLRRQAGRRRRAG